ncbi:uncharacterized protein FOMMEDRAFT_154282 [Fomitiporia mediterranea MF3/22]|uniref:uncharacterized protein n=1 Tax=Fomitiporia mediterranea (strain MF3/22) TaxID=694068 RepID=UPI0004409BA4|nr:uncharacterized protein FOMMEDRAFT_154282 [Fomitiporia mediterranea MF3/22]EJD05101.1 hypothetical protein FOMMEDRAFT_154282 [Fomitiporia mediterranea MF3/22]
MSIVSHLDEEVEYIWVSGMRSGQLSQVFPIFSNKKASSQIEGQTKYLGSVFLMYVSNFTDKRPVDNDTAAWPPYSHDASLRNVWRAKENATVIRCADTTSLRMQHPTTGIQSRYEIPLVIMHWNLKPFHYNGTKESLDKGEIRPFTHDIGVHNTGCLSAPFMSGISWAAVSSVELLLFVLVLWKTIQVKGLKFPTWISRSTNGPRTTQDIATLMARDSVVYFAVIFSVALLGSVLTFLSERSDSRGFLLVFFRDSNAYQTIVITIMTILAPKMLINIRAEYYGPVGIIATEISWDQISEHPRPQITNDVEKLTRY